MNGYDPWRTSPRKTVIVFLLAVFFIFTIIGFADDILAMGRENPLRFAVGTVLSGLFAVTYAVTGISLRGGAWKVYVPLFVVQFLTMGLLARFIPDAPGPKSWDAAHVANLESRLAFDGIATIVAVSLGYAGFAYVSISEAKRYAKTRGEMTVLESEMAAARAVQQVILPHQDETFPGFAVESVYMPAQQVGGDFFQIMRDGNGGLMFVIGDVAGKGLPAAMLVSLLVGSIRATAEDCHDPALMLRKLHDRLTGRTSGGFCTALAARIGSDGQVTLANAGHLSPYLDGREVELPGALPLGIRGGGRYEATHLQLDPGSRLTFLSDGVVEAQNQDGQLFGFERAREISAETADAIAKAAAQFGQADDITVVTIDRQMLAK